MSNYSYEAVDGAGLKVEGNLEVLDQNEAIRRVKEMGLFPVRIFEARGRKTEAGGRKAEGRGPKAEGGKRKAEKLGGARGTSLVTRHSSLLPRRRRVKAAALAVFTRQLATLVEAGMPLLRGLRLLREQEESASLARITDEISEQIEGGSSLSEALAQHPKVFNPLFVNMVKAGELSGALEVTLRRLAEFMEKGQKIKGKVKAAMFYPVAVLVVATGILTLLMTFVVPKFREVFAGLGGKMPWFTQKVLDVSMAFREHFVWMALAMVALWVAFVFLIRTQAGRKWFDGFKLRAPVVGPLFRKLAISRFARTLGTLVANGVPILQALNIVKETTGNVVVSRVVEMVHESVKEGETIAAPLRASRVFPAMVAGMVDIGEQTGALPDMLMKVADNYDDQVDNAVASMTSLLEPILIVFLAVVVGGIVIAMFLPLIEIINHGIDGGQRE